MERLLDTNKKTLIILIVLIIISDVIIFFPFLNGKYVYVWLGWGYDTYHSYVPAYELLAEEFRKFRFIGLSFQYGLGTDIINFNLMAGNPIILFIIVIAAVINNHTIIPNIMIIVPFVVSLFSGFSIFIFLKDKALSQYSVLIASYCYALSGYLVCTGMHYWFAPLMIWFPALLHSIDCCEKEEYHKFYLWVLLISLFATVYGALALFFVAGLYIIFKSLHLNSNKLLFWKNISINAILGVLSSSVLFIPFLYEIVINSDRTSNVSNNMVRSSFSFIELSEAVTGFLRLFSNNIQGGVDTFNLEARSGSWFECFPVFFSILFVMVLPQYIFFAVNKKRKDRKQVLERIVLLLFLFLGLNTKVFTGLFNFYSSGGDDWRMAVVFLPFFALIVLRVFDDLIVNKLFNNTVNFASLVIYLLLLYRCYLTGHISNEIIYIKVIIWLLLDSIVLCMFSILIKRDETMINTLLRCGIGLFIIVLIGSNYYWDHRYSVIYGASPIVYDAKSKYYDDMVLKDAIERLNENEFCRVEKTYLAKGADSLWSFTNHCRSISVYNSIMNKNIIDYIDKFVDIGQPRREKLIFISYGNMDYRMFFDISRLSLLGVKTIVTPIVKNIDGLSKVLQKDGYNVYNNENIETAGVFFEDWISVREYETLDVSHRIMVENQALVIDTEENSNRSIEYNEDCVNLNDVDVQGTDFSVKADDGLIISNAKGADIIFSVITPSDEKKRIAAVINMYSSKEGRICIELKGNDFCESESFYLQEGENEFPVLLDLDTNALRLTGLDGKTIIHNISIIDSPVRFENNCRLYNCNMDGRIIGDVVTEHKGLLFVPVPYNDFWSVYVDGEKQKLIKANYGFMAVEIEKGNHKVEFCYRNRIINISAIISIVSILLFILLFRHRRNLENRLISSC